MNLKFCDQSIEKSLMYWISPKGEITGSSKGNRHINHVCSDPEYFGLTYHYVEEVYKKHNEPINLEANAREEIIVDLMKKGWIRIRRNKIPYSWVIQTYRFNQQANNNIKEWIWSMISIGYTQEEDMRLMKIDSSEERISFKDWLNRI